LNNLYIITHH